VVPFLTHFFFILPPPLYLTPEYFCYFPAGDDYHSGCRECGETTHYRGEKLGGQEGTERERGHHCQTVSPPLLFFFFFFSFFSSSLPFHILMPPNYPVLMHYERRPVSLPRLLTHPPYFHSFSFIFLMILSLSLFDLPHSEGGDIRLSRLGTLPRSGSVDSTASDASASDDSGRMGIFRSDSLSSVGPSFPSLPLSNRSHFIPSPAPFFFPQLVDAKART